MYQAFLPLASTAILAFVVFRWSTEDMRQEGKLSDGARLAVIALVSLHALIVVAASAGGAGRVTVDRELRLDLGLPLLIGGVALVSAALWSLRSLAFLRGLPVEPRATGVYRWGRHPLYMGWTAALLGVAIMGGSALALILAVMLAAALVAVARGETRRFGRPHRSPGLRIGSAVTLLAATALLLAACGGSKASGDKANEGPRTRDLRAQLGQSTDPSGVAFPAVRGQSLQQLADSIGNVGPQAALATSVYRPGDNRFAFGVIDEKTGFVYGPSAVYVADKPSAPARGPYQAPADLLVTESPYRSKQAATEKDPFSAIYAASIPFKRTGKTVALVVTQVKGQFVVAPVGIQVSSKAADKVPDIGEPAPRVHTDTLASAKGNIDAIDTRQPADDMHDTDFADVVGKKPVALLFSTPQLCSSRVCGPVTDIALQLKARYGDQMTFIHQEVYVDNDANKGLRPSLAAFNLESEPWLFVVGADGRIAARLQGSFGISAFENAVKAGLN